MATPFRMATALAISDRLSGATTCSAFWNTTADGRSRLMITNGKLVGYGCVAVVIALYIVGAVSVPPGSLRHEVQTLPLCSRASNRTAAACSVALPPDQIFEPSTMTQTTMTATAARSAAGVRFIRHRRDERGEPRTLSRGRLDGFDPARPPVGAVHDEADRRRAACL
jgi:hypothetical protein